MVVQLDHKESWALKYWCFWTVVLEKTLESPLDCKEIQPVNPKGNQSWNFTGRTDAEAEAPILWLPDANNWLIGENPDAGKDWKQEEKGTTEDEMVGWHHWLDGHWVWASFRRWWWTDRESWHAAVHGVTQSDMTEQLNWTEVKACLFSCKSVSSFFNESSGPYLGFSGGSAVKESGCQAGDRKEMATHSSILAWEIPRTEEPDGLQCTWSQRIGHDLVTKQQQVLIMTHEALRHLGVHLPPSGRRPLSLISLPLI